MSYWWSYNLKTICWCYCYFHACYRSIPITFTIGSGICTSQNACIICTCSFSFLTSWSNDICITSSEIFSTSRISHCSKSKSCHKSTISCNCRRFLTNFSPPQIPNTQSFLSSKASILSCVKCTYYFIFLASTSILGCCAKCTKSLTIRMSQSSSWNICTRWSSCYNFTR
jgi:hypothetical protein